jgi:hypothetical protein
MRRFRANHKGEVERLKQRLLDLSTNNRDTRQRFERKCGKNPRVVVMQKTASGLVADYVAEVVAFLPFGRLRLIAESGEVFDVALELVERDYGFVPIVGQYEDIVYEDSFAKRRRLGLVSPTRE